MEVLGDSISTMSMVHNREAASQRRRQQCCAARGKRRVLEKRGLYKLHYCTKQNKFPLLRANTHMYMEMRCAHKQKKVVTCIALESKNPPIHLNVPSF